MIINNEWTLLQFALQFVNEALCNLPSIHLTPLLIAHALHIPMGFFVWGSHGWIIASGTACALLVQCASFYGQMSLWISLKISANSILAQTCESPLTGPEI